MPRRWTPRCAKRSPISMRSTICTPPPNTAAAPPSISPAAPLPMRAPHAQGSKSPCALNSTSTARCTTLEVEPRTTLLDCLRDLLDLKGAHAGCEHGVCGACTVLFDGVAVRSCLMFAAQAAGSADHHHRRRYARPRRIVADPGRLLRDPRHAMRLLHAGHDPGRACAARRQSGADARTDRRGDLRQYLPLHRLCADRGSDRARRRAHARRQPAEELHK